MKQQNYKRPNRLKRKLSYIREKNRFKRGERFAVSFKITKELMKDTKAVDEFIKSECIEAIKSTCKRFKVSPTIIIIKTVTGINGDDFIKDLFTVITIFKYSPHGK